MSKQIDRILEAYTAHKNEKYINSEIHWVGNIAKIKIFSNTIALFLPDGGKIFSNCGYNTSITHRRLSELGCNYKKVKNVDLDYLCNILSSKYETCKS